MKKKNGWTPENLSKALSEKVMMTKVPKRVSQKKGDMLTEEQIKEDLQKIKDLRFVAGRMLQITITHSLLPEDFNKEIKVIVDANGKVTEEKMTLDAFGITYLGNAKFAIMLNECLPRQPVVCDKCSKETKSLNTIEYLCHCEQPEQAGYVDSDMNAVSGRIVTKRVCNKCYNKIMYPVAKHFKK